MKKSLFILATAALVLASCNNDVTIAENQTLGNQPQEIGLTAFSNPAKRVMSKAPVDGTEFPNVSMKVGAYDVDSARTFFSAVTFSKSGNTWKGGKYWPLNPTTINFLAYANLTEGSAVWNSDAAKQVTLTMGDNKTAQNDLMYAIGTGTVIQNSDNSLAFPPSVPMVFKHAQAWIQFSVKAANSTVASALTINSITLKDVSCQGVCTVTQTNFNAASGQGVTAAWTDFAGNAADVAAVVKGDYSALSNSKQEYANLLVIPNQGITGFVINYTLDGKNYGYEYTIADGTLAQAKKYTYDINFNLHEIEIAPSIEDWDDVTPVAVEVPNSHEYAYVTNSVAGTYSVAAAAGTYTFTVTGLTAGATYDITEESAATWLSESASSVVADPNGKANVTFTVEANTGVARNANIVLTNHANDANKTKVTVSQAAGN